MKKRDVLRNLCSSLVSLFSDATSQIAQFALLKVRLRNFALLKVYVL